MKLTDAVIINGKTVKNRVVMPPMVIGLGCVDGFPTENHVRHYRARSLAGTGLMVVEATAVMPEGRLGMHELGLWDDEHTRPMARLAEACHEGGALALVQIHHAGPRTVRGAGKPVGASEFDNDIGHVRALTGEEIAQVHEAFVQTALRAKAAGFDGVELHGCHGYLLNAFANPKYNQRTDEYGGSTENRTRLTCGIIRDIAAACGEDFIITVRMGGSDPDLKESVAIARAYVAAGAHGLSVSFGMQDVHPDVPADFPMDGRFYEASVIREALGGCVPVMAVGGIRTAASANQALDYADMVCAARAMLADDWFPVAVLRGKDPVYRCCNCRGGCRWPDTCPASEKRRREMTDSPL